MGPCNKRSSKSDCDVRSHANVKLHNKRSQIVRLLAIIPDCCLRGALILTFYCLQVIAGVEVRGIEKSVRGNCYPLIFVTGTNLI